MNSVEDCVHLLRCSLLSDNLMQLVLTACYCGMITGTVRKRYTQRNHENNRYTMYDYELYRD